MSIYAFQAWPTPTPIPTTAATPAFAPALDGMNITLAEQLVQGYQQANQYDALEMLMFALLALLIIGGIWSIIQHVKQL